MGIMDSQVHELSIYIQEGGTRPEPIILHYGNYAPKFAHYGNATNYALGSSIMPGTQPTISDYCTAT